MDLERRARFARLDLLRLSTSVLKSLNQCNSLGQGKENELFVRWLLVISIALLMLMTGDWADAVESSTLDEAERSDKLKAIAQLQPEQIVRIDARDMGRIEGPYLRTVNDTILIKILKKGYLLVPEPIEVDLIEGLWTKRTRDARSWAIKGGVVGLVVGGYVAGEFSDDSLAGIGNVFVGAVVGLAVGVGLGMSLSTAIPSWEKKYP
jgi:hypothetical protein